MKKILLLSALLFLGLCKSQVGVNTSNPNSILTVEGSLETAYKEISSSYLITNLDYYITYNGASAATITLPAVQSGSLAFSGRTYKIKNISAADIILSANGTDKIRNQNAAGTSTFIIPAGNFVEVVNNINTSGNGTWDLSYVGYPNSAPSNYSLANVYDFTSTAPQSVTASAPLTGFSQTVTIPANKDAKVVINYSIPVGTPVGVTPNGYYGITMLRNNVEVQAGSRKSTQIPNSAGAGSSVVSINGMYANNIAASSTAQTFTYSLNAYLENSNTPVLFGMNSATGNNFNWGYGYWTVTVYIKN
ncbi:MAG: hypothetical protein ACN6N7_05980 [Chryseobacterium culicis]